MQNRRLLLVLTVLLALGWLPSAGAKQNAERCAAAKDAATSQLAAARLACLRAALLQNQPVAASCVTKAAGKFLGKLERIQRKGGCRTGADGTTLVGLVDAFAGKVEGALGEIPTEGALRVTWVLRGGGSPVSCETVSGQAGMSVILTPVGAGSPIVQAFPCGPGQGDMTNIPFGSYSMVVDILNGQQQSLGASATQEVTFAETGCDLLIAGDCAKAVAVDVSIL